MPLGPSEVFMRDATVRAAMMLIYRTLENKSENSTKVGDVSRKLEIGRYQIENQIWLVPQ